jgi:hypothetical protein
VCGQDCHVYLGQGLYMPHYTPVAWDRSRVQPHTVCMYCAVCGELIEQTQPCEIHGGDCPEYNVLWTYGFAAGAAQLAMLYTPLPDDLWDRYVERASAHPYPPMFPMWVEQALDGYRTNP